MNEIERGEGTGTATEVPLCVSLEDGLIHDQVAVEAWRRHPADGPDGPLPLDTTLLDTLEKERAGGRRLVLVATGDEARARSVKDHAKIFHDLVIVRHETERGLGETLADHFGTGRFDFIGRPAHRAQVEGFSGEFRVHDPSGGTPRWRTIARAMRVHQWLKNLLLFLPVLAGQQFGNPDVLLKGVLAFVAFSFTASSVYLINDLVDLRADRQHPVKRRRPFASGALPLSAAPPLLTVLLGATALITWLLLPVEFALTLGVYLVVAFAYSFRLKGAILIDVITLAGLYTLRVIAGGAATGISPSVWLLGFSLFFFLSLAMVKRYAELHGRVSNADVTHDERLPGRGYQPRDLPILIALGIGTGSMAVLVLALYVISDEFSQHYRYPVLLWLLCPLAFYWIGRAWIVVARDEMEDDPVVWAVTDQLSRWVAVAAIATLLLAR